MPNVFDIADFFIQVLDGNTDYPVTNLKLNKLLYFAHGYNLAHTGRPLFDDPIRAWKYGPVVPNVWAKYTKLGNKPIPANSRDLSSAFTSREYNFLLDVAREYGGYSASELVNITHEPGAPWDVNKKEITIPNDTIKGYFRRRQKLISFDEFIKDIPVVGYTNSDGILVLPADCNNGDNWSSECEMD